MTEPADAPDDAELTSAVETLRTAIRLINRRLKIGGIGFAEEGDDLPTITQSAVLSVLDQDGPLTATALAAHELVRPQSMAQTVAAMVDAGWLLREPHQSDRRQVVLSMTDRGREMLAQQRAQRQTWLIRAVRGALTDTEQHDFVRIAQLLLQVARY